MDFKKAYNDLLYMWGGQPDSGNTGHGNTGHGGHQGTGNGYPQGTGNGYDCYETSDGCIQLPTRRLRKNEMRKLLEGFFRDNGRLPRDPYEFERWLDS